MKRHYTCARICSLAVAVFLAHLPMASGDTLLGYADLLERVKAHSPGLKTATAKIELADRLDEQAELNYLPRIYLDAKTVSSNDPGTAFMAQLLQKKTTASDLSPSALNDPSRTRLTSATIGFDLALYEGGGATARQQAATAMTSVAKHQQLQSKSDVEAEVATLYGELLNRSSLLTDLEPLADQIDNLLGGYQTGKRTNPVGYAGLLGLRSVRNRIESLIAENERTIAALRATLEERAGGLPEGWEIVSADTKTFAETNLIVSTSNTESNGVLSARRMAVTEMMKATADKADALPRIGLFGEITRYRGDRGTAGSNTVGIYLSWDIFNPSSQGAGRLAAVRSGIAQTVAEQIAEKERITRAQAHQTLVALNDAIIALTENANISAEQVEVANDLYKSGSINALQYSSILGGRTQALKELTDAKSSYLAVRAVLHRTQPTTSEEKI